MSSSSFSSSSSHKTQSDSVLEKSREGEGEKKKPSFKNASFKRPFKGKKAKEETPEQKAKKEALNQTLTWLCETFPECFNRLSPKPLKQGILSEIFLHLSKEEKSPSRKSLRLVLSFYTNQSSYHRAVVENQHRFNLEGLAVEEIQFPHKDRAKSVLEERKQRKKAWLLGKEKKNKETPLEGK